MQRHDSSSWRRAMLLIATAALACGAAYAQDARKSEAQLKSVRQQILELEQQLTRDTARRDEGAKALRAAETESAAAARKLADVRAKLAEQRAAREVEIARKREEEKKAAEQARHDRALTGSYASAADIDQMRDRAIAEIEKNAGQAKTHLEAALKKQQQLDQEKEFYAKKPIPAPLTRQIEDNAKEVAMHQKAIEQKDADIAATRERFDADKARFLQITGQAPRKPQ